MATEQALNDLKAQWCEDPCWDLEHTEGFEDHEAELKAFSDAHYAKLEAEAEARLAKKAESLGCPGNTALALYVEGLEHRLSRLEDKLSN